MFMYCVLLHSFFTIIMRFETHYSYLFTNHENLSLTQHFQSEFLYLLLRMHVF